jgi:hypothetical protein
MSDCRELPEPVRRYLRHAIPDGAAVPAGVELEMTGRIRAGVWLPFRATQRCDGRSFVWCASIGLGPLRPLVITDRYENAVGSMTGTVLGGWKIIDQTNEDTARSAAGRAALESVFAPGSLLPGRGFHWHVAGEDHIVAITYNHPERVEVHLHVGHDGQLHRLSARRWGEVTKGHFGYHQFGADVQAERRFGALVIPSRVIAGWGYGTDHYIPFFDAAITAARPVH